jgi:hypothetical protein
LGSQRHGDSFDGTASDEISTKSAAGTVFVHLIDCVSSLIVINLLPPAHTEPSSLGELYTKKDSIKRGIESLFVAATPQSS